MKINNEKEALLLQNRLKELLRYDFETGEFHWIAKTSKNSSIKLGQIAGTRMKDGYVRIVIDGYNYYAHRLAWAYVHGHFPFGDEQIDHADGDRFNNRINNLTVVSPATNTRNQKMHSTNTSGVTGVYHQKVKRSSGDIAYYWTAGWCDASGKLCFKCFPVEKLGYTKAKELAIMYRTEQLEKLGQQGLVYSNRHGK